MVYRLPSLLLLAVLMLTVAASLQGCGLVAWPVRTSSNLVKAVPVVGDVASKPLDVAADAID